MAKRKSSQNNPLQPRKRAKLAGSAAIAHIKDDRTSPLSQPVLTCKYNRVCSLETYFREKLPSTSRVRQRRLVSFPSEHPEYADFLKTTLVGILDEATLVNQRARLRQLHEFTETQRSVGQHSVTSVVDFAIWFQFQKDAPLSKRPRHVLCQGFLRSGISASRNDISTAGVLGLVQIHPNSSVEALKSPPWTYLMSLLGEDGESIICRLLLDCGLYQKLPSGDDNYFQLSGVPIQELMLKNERMPVNCSSKMKRINRSCSRYSPSRPSEIIFVRNRIFYAKPSLNKQGNITLGLKHIHVLNRNSDIHDHTQNIRFMCYVFPRQFGLHNVFTSSVDKRETVQPFKDYTIREEEIAELVLQRKLKIPKRLREEPLELIRKIRRNHLSCSYSQLLRHYCHVGFHLERTASANALRDLNNASDQKHFEDQRIFCEPAAAYSAITSEQDSDDLHMSFIPHATPAFQVSLFCQAVIRHLLPNNVFGSGPIGSQNWNKINDSVHAFVYMRRFESLSLHEVTNGLQLASIPWLVHSNAERGNKLCLSDRLKRQEILYEFIYYVFDSVLVPLIRSNFYVTETGVHRNRIFYFRHDVWRRLSEPFFMSMRFSNLRPISARQVRVAYQSNHLGHSQVRLLPKDRGARPITNLRRRTMLTSNGKLMLGSSINAKLTPVFDVINYERIQSTENLASAMFSVGDICARLKAYKEAISAGPNEALYFAKVDIKSAFDSIPQGNLLSLMDKFFQHDNYQVAKHVEAKWLAQGKHGEMGRTVNRFIGGARPQDNLPVFSTKEADRIASKKRRTVFSGTEKQRTWSFVQLKRLLSSHVQANLVKVGRKHFRQIEGIPQGSVLSSFLCSFFYTDFEKRCLDFIDQKTSLLLRLIDDFLLITTDKQQAIRFVNVMNEGNEFYGIGINAKKSLVNFNISVHGMQVPEVANSSAFPYCGLTIDTHSLQVSRERQPRDLQVSNSLTIDMHGRAGLAFRRRSLAALQIQLHTILLDPSINNSRRIFRNLLECFGETGMKMHRYRSGLSSPRRPKQNMVINTIKQMVELALSVTHRRLRSHRAVITKGQMCWLAASAFLQILSPKQSQYKQVLFWLMQLKKAKEHSMNMPARVLERLIKDGLEQFSRYKF